MLNTGNQNLKHHSKMKLSLTCRVAISPAKQPLIALLWRNENGQQPQTNSLTQNEIQYA